MIGLNDSDVVLRLDQLCDSWRSRLIGLGELGVSGQVPVLTFGVAMPRADLSVPADCLAATFRAFRTLGHWVAAARLAFVHEGVKVLADFLPIEAVFSVAPKRR